MKGVVLKKKAFDKGTVSVLNKDIKTLINYSTQEGNLDPGTRF